MLFEFAAAEDWQLSIADGEVVTVITESEDGWWEVVNSRGEQGCVPSTYLEVLAPPPTSRPPPPPAKRATAPEALPATAQDGGGNDGLSTDPAVAKFVKMIKLGTPRPAVENKMVLAGLDPAALEAGYTPPAGQAGAPPPARPAGGPSFLAGIAGGGANLKTAKVEPRPAPASSNPMGGLMAAIQAGPSLRKVSAEELAVKKPPAPASGLMGALASAMDKKFAAVRDSDSESEGEDGWSASDKGSDSDFESD